jgi:hypothetical protein
MIIRNIASASGKFIRENGKFVFALFFIWGSILGFFSSQTRAQSGARSGMNPANLQGDWKGTLGGQLHLIVTLAMQPDGTYTGNLNSVDQGATLPLVNVKFDGDSFRFEVTRIGGVYDAKINKDGNKMTGTWTQTGVGPQPLDFLLSPPSSNSNSAAYAKPVVPPQKPLTVPVDVVIPIAPTAFEADGKMHMVYELHVVNYGHENCRLTDVEAIRGDSAPQSLGRFSGSALDGMTSRPGVPGATDRTNIAPGSAAVVYIWLTVDTAKDVPTEIRHSISAKIGDYPDAISVETAPITVLRGPVVISSPLRGEQWEAGNGPSNTSAHRRALIPINGRADISQRFAIDWVRLYPDGATFHGDHLDNKSYLAFGEITYAAADGIITELKDGIPENVPGSPIAPITLETVAGNHVMLDIGNGRYALYAHMQPGSIRVHLGEKVHRGQVIGLVGNTGNSTEPHLHFHICNGNSPLGSEGLPYAFASFEVQGKGAGWKSANSHTAPVKHLMEIPTEDEVVKFSESE